MVRKIVEEAPRAIGALFWYAEHDRQLAGVRALHILTAEK
jgi:hypothetical protein